MEVTDEMLKVARSMQSFELMIKRIIELHEANKPKQNLYGYFKVTHVGVIDCNKTDNGAFPLYTTPPTREPLSASKINDIIEDVLPHGTMLDLIRAIEQAHGIGVTNE